MNRIARYLPSALVAALVALLAAGIAPANATGCQLATPGNGVKHIVYLQFDNVHLRRDNPNVPSDLEQIPSLLHFLEQEGTLLTNHHTPLISHTSVDILTSLTGVYGEKMGIPIGNTILYFAGTGSNFTSSFAYWTDNLGTRAPLPATTVPHMIDQRGKVHPAPWVPFTRAGCDVGAFSLANIELENTTSDIDTVFGPTSSEHNEAHDPSAAVRTKAQADFEGIAIHCGLGSTLCAFSPRAIPDILADEPQGYIGFQALFGNKYVAPAINHGNGFVLDLDGNHVTDSSGNDGFPGFSPTPSQTLGYAAQMLEAGVPVLYLYIEDAHDNHGLAGAPIPTDPDGTFGPGEADYVAQLAIYDAAFSKFFARLAADGITKDNTLFVITSDENDHFAGSVAKATPAGCDGIKVPCTYPMGAKGEVEARLEGLLQNEFGDTTGFGYDFDSSPGIWINGNPAQTDPVTRKLERDAGGLQGFDPIAGGNNQIMAALADRAEQALLHMITSDPQRTPTFVMFSNPDYFLTDSGTPAVGSAACPAQMPPSTAPIPGCFLQTRNFAWNHGDFQSDITHTWLGIVGPGVRENGRVGELFTDHTDIRPTMLSLAHLKDDYAHDGRVVFEIIKEDVLPDSLGDHRETLSDLAEAYKQINAPLGKLGRKTLAGISTRALKGSDATYATLEGKIVDLTHRRNEIAGKMIAILEVAAFDNHPVDQNEARRLIEQARDLLESID
jgi:hypothetical protein